MISFTVFGVPAPKGSKSAFAIRKAGKLTGRVTVVEGKTDRQRDWSRRVEEVVQKLASDGQHMLDGPLGAVVTFYLPRPASAPKRRTHPDRKPDVDKLLRAILDPMTGVLVADDARFCDIHVTKAYADPASSGPRAHVTIWTLSGEEVNEEEAPRPVTVVSS